MQISDCVHVFSFRSIVGTYCYNHISGTFRGQRAKLSYFRYCEWLPRSGVCAGGRGDDDDDEDALEGDWLVGACGWSSSSLGVGEGLPKGDS